MNNAMGWLRAKFDAFLDAEGEKSKATLFYLFVSASFFFLTILLIGCVLFLAGRDPGTFGDFIGGTLNPILTFLTFMGLLLTIVLQQAELRDTRAELAKSATALENQIKSLDRQNFEATFFEMLSLQNALIDGMEVIGHNNQQYRARAAIMYLFQRFKGAYNNSENADNEDERIDRANDIFWKEAQPHLSHYYRFLYNMIRFIHESDVDRRRYMRLVRAQLSDQEVILLFYTSMSERGRRFGRYIDKYALFDNLPRNMLILPKHTDHYTASAYDDPNGEEFREWEQQAQEVMRQRARAERQSPAST